MNHSDEVSSAVVGISTQVAQKGVEVAQSIVDKSVDNIAKLLQALFAKKGENQGKSAEVTSSDMTDIKSGEVCVKELVADAKKNSDTIICTDGFSKSDMKFIAAKASEYGIPVAFTGKENEENICAHVHGCDKPMFERICTEMMTDKLKARPQELDNFKVERWEIDGIHRELSKHNLNANWGKTREGEYFCLFEKADKKAVMMARDEFIRKCDEVERNLDISKGEDGFYIISDKRLGNVITFDEIPPKSELSAMFQEKFGYDENKAEIACGKFGENHLEGNVKRDYFGNNPQMEFYKTRNHIELTGENILVKNYDCLRLTPKANGIPCVVFRDRDNNFAILNPEKMTRREMADIIRESLGIDDEKTVNALVDKAERVNDYYVKQSDENFNLTRTGIIGDVQDDISFEMKTEIERLGKNGFEVSSTTRIHEAKGLNVDGAAQGDSICSASLVLSFSDKKTALHALTEMYIAQGLSEEMAKQSAKDVFAKAQAQSAEKVLHIEEIKVSQQSAETHGATSNESTESVVTVKYGNQSQEFNINDRDTAMSEIGGRFGVPEDEVAVVLDKAQERIESERGTVEKAKANEKPLNNHEVKPAAPIETNVKPETEIPEAPKAPAPKRK
jgi:1,2-phenylacetyl-CoA epoxidase PaaB subunit